MRVLPDVAAIDKEFDYWVPAELDGEVRVGSVVRVDLHGRRVGGWVVAAGVEATPGVDVRPLAKVSGWGPEPALVELASWAAWRWAGKRAHFLRAASAGRTVARLPAPAGVGGAPAGEGDAPAGQGAVPAGEGAAPGGEDASEVSALAAGALCGGLRVLRLPPGTDLTPVVVEATRRGPALVVVPTVARAAVLASRLRRRGGSVALLPDDWAEARAGADVVVGTRGAAWAPCPGLAAVVVVDGHDESLTQKAAPTWNAVAVVAERARRTGAACAVVSACPTPELVAAAAAVIRPSLGLERNGWPQVDIVDRRGDDPRLGLWSEALAALIHGGGRVACVLNRRGRGRLLACAQCRELARCERCGAALAESAGGAPAAPALGCPRCGHGQPSVCAACGSMRLKRLRIGVSRARDELEALAGRPVVEVSGPPGKEAPAQAEADLIIGTQAVLARSGPLDAVAFVDFDQELLAPRLQAGADALAMLAGAGRLLGGRRRGGRLLVQTRMPDHPVLWAAAGADPDLWLAGEQELRAALRLPPAAAVAVVSGSEAAGEYAGALSALGVEVIGPNDGRWLVKAGDHAALAGALAGVARPAGRLRVEVDPWRL